MFKIDFLRRTNFEKFCNPDRETKCFWKSEKIEQEEFEVTEEISLIDLDSNLKNSTVVQSFLGKDDKRIYQSALNAFYVEACKICGFDVDDLYFEDFHIFKKQIYYLEVHRFESFS